MKKKFGGILTLLLAFVVQLTFAQEKTITGTVSDNSGLPLPGATVLVKGTSSGTSTDFDGKYSIKASTGSTLVYSFVGYVAKQMVIESSSTINVSLLDDNELEEVVVIAYGTANRATVTSAINTINADEIESRPTASLAQALQGLSPGLNIATGNGQPGANSTILLRGINSINGNVEPLFIIDGVPVDEDSFRSINQADIASATVLKDASATAIYGNRATGGVIVLTTKKGSYNKGLEVKYSGRTGFTAIPKANFNLANSKELLEIERAAGAGTGAGTYNAYIGSVLGVSGGTPLTDAEIDRISSTTDTNWQDYLLRTGLTTSHDLAFTSGSDKLTSYTSLGYFEQEGITLRSKLQRMTFRNNMTYKSEDNKFQLSTTLSGGFSRSDIAGGIGLGTGGSGSLSNPFIVPFVGKPYLSPFNADGTRNIIGNPNFADSTGFLNTPYVAQNVAAFDTNRETEIRIIGGLNSQYNFTDDLSASVGYGIDFTEITGLGLVPTNSLRGAQANDENAQFQGFQSEAFNRDTRMNLDAKLNYSHTFGEKHNMSALGAVEFIYAENSGFSYAQTGLIPGLEGTGAGFVSGNTTEDPNNDGVADYFYIPGVNSFKLNVSQFSYFGKAAYDYDQITGFDVTVRRDASSRFNSTNKWGTFWAAGVFVNLTKSLFKANDVINDLKLRGSYGVTGNDRVANGYYGGLVIPFDLFNTGQGYNGSVGLFPSQIGNPNLKWETTTKANIGIDFGLLKNKLTGSFDVYKNETKDVFITRPNTAISGGFTGISDNVGTLENSGIELMLNYKIVNNDKFFWSIGANASYNKNEITSLPGTEPNANGDIILNAAQGAVEAVGYAFNTFYAVRWAGVNPTNGRPLYLDRDGNTTEDYSVDDRVFTNKSSIPVYQGGFNTSLSYKGFSLDANFTFAADVYRDNGTLAVAEDPGLINISNVTSNLVTAWKQPGDITSIPALNTGSVRLLFTDRYIEDASYLRLKTIALGYSLPEKMLGNTPLSSIRIYAQAENLLTWTKWRGFDPEFDPFATNDFFTFPNSRIFTLGLDIKL
ncbi:MAG: TonB-linked SusC/RagA family outer membrane protein [Sediminicola sp.]|jgi:TonB-linked SusC/RagA family outer membrane protein